MGARVPDGLYDRVQAAAQGRGWTISEYLKWVLTEHFVREGKYER